MFQAYPWASRPDHLPLTADEVCEALADANGDIVEAAQALRVGSLILRKFIERSSRARAVIREMDARVIDTARKLVIQALNSPDDRRADWAIRFVLQSRNARGMGYGTADDDANTNPNRVQANQIPPAPTQWASGEAFNTPRLKPPQTIDLAANPPAPDAPSAKSDAA